MSWGNDHVRTAQALLLTLSAIMLALLMVMVLEARDREPDRGVVWQEPASLSVEEVRVGETNSSFLLAFHLWDSKARVTKWDGELALLLADEDNQVVLDVVQRVRASDFTTVRSGGVLDTYLLVEVPFSGMVHVTTAMRARPGYEMGVRATFSYGQQVLADEVNWWLVPTFVKVERVYVDEEEGWILLDVFLLDGTWRTTRWSGDLRVIVEDSTGFDMHNRSSRILAADFNRLTWGGSDLVWYRTWVLFEDIRPSKDRLGNDSANGSAGWMRVQAWFEHEGITLRQAPDGPTAVANTVPIPPALMAPNTAPVVGLSTQPWGLTGDEHLFDASATRDDLGIEGLVYEWSWGDGSVPVVTTEPRASHSFSRPGSFEVVLKVTDREGASSYRSVSVGVLLDPRDLPDGVLWGDLPERLFGSLTARPRAAG